MKFINPITFINWNDFVLQNENYSVFHSAEWCKLLNVTYGYKPYYLTKINGKNFDLMIPVMEVNSIFTGARLVSLPFTDYCDPIVDTNYSFNDIINSVGNILKAKKLNYFDIKGGARFFDKEKIFNDGYLHKLNLDFKENFLYSNLRSSNKRNIKKAIKEGVQIRFSKDYKSIVEFYKLNLLTRQRHGIPPQPFQFFKNLYNILIQNNMGETIEALYNNRVIASSLFLLFNKKVIYKYGASDYKYQNLRANDLLFWEAIKHYRELNFEEFCFGRTEKDHVTLRQFKLGWGVRELEAPYFRYNFKKKVFVTNQNFSYSFSGNLGINKYTSKLPVPILKLIGTIAYRHIG